MVLYEIVRGKPYYAITFRDIPEEYILGGSCLVCAHTGPVNRFRIERFWSKDESLRVVDDHLRCLACGNKDHNTFMVFGRRVRKIEQKPMPATVVFGEPPPEPSLRGLYQKALDLHPPKQDPANGNRAKTP